MRIRVIFTLGLLFLLQSVAYNLFFMGNTTKEQDVVDKIEGLVAQANEVAYAWRHCHNTTQFVDDLWNREMPAMWEERGVSLYLYANDSLVYWANHLLRCDIDSASNSSSRTIEVVDGNTILSFHSERGNRKAIVVIKLAGEFEGYNQYLFEYQSHPPLFFDYCPAIVDDDHQIQEIEAAGRRFYVELPIDRKMPLAVNGLGWIGMLLLLWAFKASVRRGVTSRNALQKMVLTLLLFALFRVVMNYVDIPNGGSYSWSSIGSLLVTQLLIIFVVQQAYSMRFRLRQQLLSKGKVAQYSILVVSTLLMCLIIAYFHYTMVRLIHLNLANVELYNIFSLNIDSLIFYVICAVFVSMRMLYVRVFSTMFGHMSFSVRSMLSMLILLLIVIAVEPTMGNTGWLLLMFHLLLLFSSYLSRHQSIGKMMMYDLLLFTAYICFFSVIESSNSRQNRAKYYVDKITHDTQWADNNTTQQHKSVAYTIITPQKVVLSPNNNLDIQLLLLISGDKTDTTLLAGNYIHIIKRRPSDGATIVVSFERPTLLDIISLASYIFLWLFITSTTLLHICSMQTFKRYNHRSLFYRVRAMIFFVVIGSMGIVAIVVYQYSSRDYRQQQQIRLTASMQDARKNFDAFAQADSSDKELIERWLKMSNLSKIALINLYDTTGHRIGGAKSDFAISQLNCMAYKNLKYNNLPYCERYTKVARYDYSIAYTPLFWQTQKVGYMGLILSSPHEDYRRYELLSSIFNVFVVVLLLSVILSLALYTVITKPLNTLYDGLNGIRQMRKIKFNKTLKLDNEVGALIVQYNSMIDYLEESYLALARSEREGAWREMARQVAHEIKNPLTPMRLKIQMLQRSRAQGVETCLEQLDSTLDVLLEQIDILTKIATEFSDLARLPQGAIVRVELAGMLQNTVGLYSINDLIDVRFEDNSSTPVYVNVDYASMTRVVVNLLQNSMQAIDGCGSITVRLDRVDCSAVIEVEDSGSGIEAEMFEHLFEPNFTTKSNGSGLGLAICRQIVEGFSGTITARNIEDGGAVFTVTLPLA